MEKNDKVVIILLIIIIAILSALCVLFATGTITFKPTDTEVNNPNQSTDNNSETKNIKTEDIKEIFKVAYNYYESPAVYCGKTESEIVEINGAPRKASAEFTTYDEMLKSLKIDKNEKLKNMSKGTKEKVQLILVMSRNADLYILDEPIGGVDPAIRNYILKTILNNYNENSTLLIATHLISEIENICDDVLVISDGQILLQGNVDEIREEKGKSIDILFREEFKCWGN